MPRPCSSRVRNRSSKKFRPGVHPRPRRLLVEPLEDRRLLAEIIAHWQGGSGNWSDTSHWDIGVVPNNGGGNTYTVVLDAPDQVLDISVDLAVTISGLTNAETVQVAAGRTLSVSGPVANTGDLIAAGGTLRLTSSTVTNGGRSITADGGIVEVKDSTISGGVLRATDNAASFVRFSGDVTLNGVPWEDAGAGVFQIYHTTARLLGDYAHRLPAGYVLVVESYGSVDTQWRLVGGEFVNEGTVLLRSRRVSSQYIQYRDAALYLEADTTLSGPGEVLLTEGNSTYPSIHGAPGAGLTVGSQQRIRGLGTINPSVVNQGTIEADISGQTLTISAALRNDGLVRASSGGTLRFDSATVTNAGRTITADGGTLEVKNGLELNGVLTLASSGSHTAVEFSGTQTLSGSGEITFGGTSNAYQSVRARGDGGSNPATLTIGAGITIHGSQGGTIGGYYGGDTVVNQGEISVGDTQGMGGSLAPLSYDERETAAIAGGRLLLDGWTSDLVPQHDFRDAAITAGGGFIVEADVNPPDSTNEVGKANWFGIAFGMTQAAAQASSFRVASTNNSFGILMRGNVGRWPGEYSVSNADTFPGEGAIVYDQAPTANEWYHLRLTVRPLPGQALFVPGQGASVDVEISGDLDADQSTPRTGTYRARYTFDWINASNYIVLESLGASSVDNLVVSALVAFIPVGSGPFPVLFSDNFDRPDNGDTDASRSITVTGTGGILKNEGTLRVANASVLDWNGTATFEGTSRLVSQPGGTVSITGDLLGNTVRADLYAPQGTTRLDGTGTAAAPQLLEVMGADVGADPAGFDRNFAYATITLANNTYVRLVDQSDNAAGSGNEALYVNSLIVPTGTTLDLNGLHVYARLLQVDGTVTGCEVSQIPDRALIALKTPTASAISAAGELDEWTFSGHGGRSVTVVLNPGSGNPPAASSPHLSWAEVCLVDPAGTVLATAKNSTSGALVTLTDVPLTVDGTYRVQVHASSGHTSNTGNYMLTVSEVLFPRIAASTPFGPAQEPVGSIAFAFNHAMDENSFSLASDVISFTGPNGAIAPTGFSWTDTRHLKVAFSPQASLGQYRMVLGPDILDREGKPLDQNQDSAAGDALKDQYVASFAIEAPRVVNYTPIDPIAGAFHAIALDFNKPIDQTSFSLAEDVVSFTGPAGAIAVSGYRWVDANTLEIQFPFQTDTGQYNLVIGPNILDLSGRAMDQNQDFVTGDPVDDKCAAAVLVVASGTVDRDMTFAGLVLVSNSLAVVSGATLTIEPGAILKFAGGAGLNVYGRLVTQGTASNPVIFTSLKDDSAGGDTNGDGNVSSPAAGDWRGISFFNPTLASTLDGVTVRYTGNAISVGTYNGPTSGFVKLNGARLDHNSQAIEAGSAFSQVEAQNTLITANDQGFLAVGTAGVTFRNCTIVGNTNAGTIGHPVLTIENTIAAFNSHGFSGWPSAGDVEVRNSDIADADGAQLLRNAVGAQAFQQNGNIVADPLFVDRAAGNYELAAGSPAIDAGRGTLAPSTDIRGRARFDDPGMPNTGTGFPSYVDIGAFERQQATQAADLAVTVVSRPTPEFVHAGDPFSVQWTVTNVGLQNAVGPWQDVVYLSADPTISPDDQVLAQRTHYGTLAAGASYSQTFSGTAPSTSGVRYVLVKTNADSVITDPVTTNNILASAGVLAVDLPALTLATPVTGTVRNGQWTYVRFDATAGATVLLNLDAAAASGANGLYVRVGTPPTLDQYDVKSAVPSSPDQQTRILSPLTGTYYVGIYGGSLPGGSSAFTVSASLTSLAIREVTPQWVSSFGPITLKIVGDNFTRNSQVTLVAPDGSTVIEGDEWFQDSSTLFATFHGENYSTLVVTEPGVGSVTKYDALYPVPEYYPRIPPFSADLVVPAEARPGREITVTVQYTNELLADLSSPLMTLASLEGTSWLLPGADPEQGWITSPSVSFLAISHDGPASILRAGQKETLTITVRTPFTSGEMPFTLYAFGIPFSDGPTQPIDWTSLGANMRPPDTPDDAWNPLFGRLKAQVGTTWGDYLNALRDNADHLAEIGQRVYDSAELFAFELVQAATMGSPAYLEAA